MNEDDVTKGLTETTECAARLAKAREKGGYSSARSAALALGIKPSTYAAHENGQNEFNFDQAARYASAFKVSVMWLLYGVGEPDAPNVEAKRINMSIRAAFVALETAEKPVNADTVSELAVRLYYLPNH